MRDVLKKIARAPLLKLVTLMTRRAYLDVPLRRFLRTRSQTRILFSDSAYTVRRRQRMARDDATRLLSLSDNEIDSPKAAMNASFVFSAKYKNNACAHETCIISPAKLSEKHPTNGQAVHLFIVAPSKLIVEHVLNSSYGPPRLFSVAFRVRLKNSCEGPR